MTVTKSKIYRSIKWNSIAIFFNVVMAFAQMYILYRLLSKEDFGLMATISAAYFYLRTISTLQIGEAIIHTPELKEDPKKLSSLFWLMILVALICYLIIVLFGPYYSNLFSNLEIYHGLLLIGILLFSDVIYEIYKSLLHKEMYFKELFKISFIGKLGYFVSSILLAYYGFGYKALLFSYILTSITESILAFFLGRKLYTLKFHFNFQELKPILQFGGYSTARRFLREFRSQIDTILIGRTFGLEVLGVYNIFKNLFLRFIKMIAPLIGNVTTPLLSIEKADNDKSNFIFYKQNRIYNLITIPFFIGLLVFGKTIIEYYFGASYLEHLFLFQLLTVAYLLANPVALMNTIVVSHGEVKGAFLWGLLSLVVYVVVIIAFLKIGIEAFAIGLIAFFVCKIITVYPFIIKRSIGGKYGEFFGSFSKELIISVIIGLAFYLFINNFELSGLMILVSMFLYGLLTFSIFVFSYKNELVDFLGPKTPTQ